MALRPTALRPTALRRDDAASAEESPEPSAAASFRARWLPVRPTLATQTLPSLLCKPGDVEVTGKRNCREGAELDPISQRCRPRPGDADG